MRLLDLVEEHDGVGPAAHALGELAALVVADVSRGRADEARDLVALGVFGHVDLDERLLVAEDLRGERAREERLADAGRTEEEERADGAARIAEARARAAEGAGEGRNGLVLADDGGGELLLEVEEACGLVLAHPADGDAGRARERFGDVVLGHFGRGVAAVLLLPRGEAFVERLAARDGVVAEARGGFEVLLGDGLVLGAERLGDGSSMRSIALSGR